LIQEIKIQGEQSVIH